MEQDELDCMLPQECQNSYFDTWDRHNSIAFTTATKGLHNAPGENNCFVNSAVQVFWHLDVFRRSYRRLSGHTCMGNSCIFCALKVIFTQFQFSDQSSLHPDALRKALAETFVNQQRFQLGHMDDAAECFENILRRIHLHIANGCHEDSCTVPHCLPHQKFSLNIIEKVVCPCGASSNPLKFNEMVHYISAKALISQARVMQETGDVLHPDRFGLLLRNANAMGDIRDCPGGCGRSVQIRRTLLNSPDVVSIGLVWDSDHPTVETTTEVARNIGTTILMQDVFHSVMQDLRTLPKLQLVGLVCYYGKHYSTFVFHSKLQVWIYFDDATVREIGKCWEDVVDKCSKGRYQPLLLLYANPNASPVPVETAPKKRTMAPGFGITGGPDEDGDLDRTHESISSQNSYHRSRTPNPEPSHPLKRQTLLPRARSVTPSACDMENSGLPVTSYDHSRQQSFVLAMSNKLDNKVKHPLKLGGQASSVSGVPGPMIPQSVQQEGMFFRNSYSSQSSSHEDENYSDYTLSTSNQYKRPTMEGFEPARLPLTPNIKGHDRKDSFKKEKDYIRADVVRYQVDPTRPHETAPTSYVPFQGQNYEFLGHDPNQPPNLPPKQGKAAIFFPGRDPSHFRQRSMSQDDEETYGVEGHTQHIIIKPMAGSQNFDQVDGVSQSHTPVQSGLATLPRKKKDISKDPSMNQKKGVVDGISQQGTNGHMSSILDQRTTPYVLGRPPPVPDKYPQSVVADKTEGSSNKTDSDKKVKKLTKKELKKAEKKKLKSEMSKSQPDLSGIAKPSLHSSNSSNNMKGSKELHDEKISYIDPKMVESILKHQGLQRNPSTQSTNSSSSIDSDSIMGKLLAAKRSEGSTTTETSFDNVSLGSHKDSGYGSSDRNSSSSTGSGSVDPYIQYFISKSMVVPRNLNPHLLQHPPHQVTDFSTSKPQIYNANMSQTNGQRKDLSTLSKEEMSRHLYETLTQRNVMHPIKESSQEDILKVIPKDQSPSSTPVRGTTPLPVTDGPSKEARIIAAPPKNFAAFQVSKSSHQKEPSIDSLDKDEVENDYFVSMCEKADDLMDSCIIAETKSDLTAALQYCDSALGCLKEAMNQDDISNKALVYAQKKHNACLLKSRSLFKRTAGQGSLDGKRSSITSSDSDNSDRPIRRAVSKERLLALGRGTPTQGQSLPLGPAGSSAVKLPVSAPQQIKMAAPLGQYNRPSGNQSSQISSSSINKQASNTNTDLQSDQYQSHQSRSHVSRALAAEKSDSESTHSRSESNSSTRSSASVPCPVTQVLPQPTSGTPAPLDAYGTLSRNKQPRRTSDPTGGSEAYKTYMNRQKNCINNNGSDSSGSDGNVQKKMSQAEIRELMENNNLQRQKQQLSGQQQKLNNLSGDTKQQSVDVKSQQVLKPGYNIAGPGESVNFAAYTNTVSPVKTNGAQLDRSVPSQGSNVAITNSQKQQLNQLLNNSNYQPVVSSVQGVPRAISSPHLNGSIQLLQQPLQQSQSTLSHLGPSQGEPFSYQQHSQQPYLSEQSLKYPILGQPTQSVARFSQPLSGQRPMPVFNQQGSGKSIQSSISGNLPQYYSQQNYPQNIPSQATVQSQNLKFDNQPQRINSPVNYNQGVSHYISSQTSSTNHQKTIMQTSSQNLIEGVQSLNIYRKNNGGPPPPPPARTTSNPDFKQQLPSSQPPPPHQKVYQHVQQDQGLEVGSSSKYKNVVTQEQIHNHQRAVTAELNTLQYKQNGFSPETTVGTQLKHAISTTGLNYASLASRPLERCASQPDCQNLIDPASYSNQDVLPSSIAQGHKPSNNANPRAEVILGNGASRNFPQTSNTWTPQEENAKPFLMQQAQDDDFLNQSTSQPNVRALASRFDTSSKKPPIKPKPNSLSRTRSKSESGSKKPKSVLKNKKNKNSKAPRKSVTFAENISNLAAGYESAAELTSFSASGSVNDRAYFSDDDNLSYQTTDFTDNDIDDGVEDSSNSDDIPTVREELACQLCHKREVDKNKAYCSKCSFYMSRLVQS